MPIPGLGMALRGLIAVVRMIGVAWRRLLRACGFKVEPERGRWWWYDDPDDQP